MNYFAHGRAHLHDPYFLAGTAIPDWLSVIDRQVRVRAKSARLFVDDPDPHLAAIARGVVQHHADDDWFHQTPTFYELNVSLAATLRAALHGEDSHRPAFLGHILIEMLLDSALIEQQPSLLDDYYAALASVEPGRVESAVNRMAARSTDRIAALLPRFIDERFLYDYSSDGKLLQRLNQVMRRVNLPPLPDSLRDVLPDLRRIIASRQADLLAPSNPPLT